ncbi:MAG: ABC transporter permease [Candidatus Hermodarchaeota archaeon]
MKGTASYTATFSAETGEIPTNASSTEFVIDRSIQDPWNNGTILVEVDDTVTISWTVRNGTMWEEYNYTSSVAGILSEIGGTSFLGSPSDTAIYLPIETASEIFETEEVNSFTILLDDNSEETIDTVTEAIEEIFSDQINVLSATATLETLSATLGTMQVFLAAIAGISLFVAGIGIMNIMIVSLLQRTREIRGSKGPRNKRPLDFIYLFI